MVDDLLWPLGDLLGEDLPHVVEVRHDDHPPMAQVYAVRGAIVRTDEGQHVQGAEAPISTYNKKQVHKTFRTLTNKLGKHFLEHLVKGILLSTGRGRSGPGGKSCGILRRR